MTKRGQPITGDVKKQPKTYYLEPRYHGRIADIAEKKGISKGLVIQELLDCKAALNAFNNARTVSIREVALMFARHVCRSKGL